MSSGFSSLHARACVALKPVNDAAFIQGVDHQSAARLQDMRNPGESLSIVASAIKVTPGIPEVQNSIEASAREDALQIPHIPFDKDGSL
jgi:hypothetical protein